MSAIIVIIVSKNKTAFHKALFFYTAPYNIPDYSTLIVNLCYQRRKRENFCRNSVIEKHHIFLFCYWNISKIHKSGENSIMTPSCIR